MKQRRADELSNEAQDRAVDEQRFIPQPVKKAKLSKQSGKDERSRLSLLAHLYIVQS